MDENIRREDNLKRIEVKIVGMNYVLKIDEDEEYIMKIVNYINKKMLEVVVNELQFFIFFLVMFIVFLVVDEFFKYFLECDEKFLKMVVESEKY